MNLISPLNSPIYSVFNEAVKTRKAVFFAGLPGVGKSFYVQQFALLAQQASRGVHLLQWDVTRNAFEAPEILSKYPEQDGVTQPIIRKAVGLWARRAIENWLGNYANETDILLGELPLLGNRLSELVNQFDDAIEPFLASQETLFIVPVPSKSLREHIETAREQSIAKPRHPREASDAAPNVLELLWQDLYALAFELGITQKQSPLNYPNPSPDYDPNVYSKTYEALLKHRQVLSLFIDQTYPKTASVYELIGIKSELSATPQEVRSVVKLLEQNYSKQDLERLVSNWHTL